MTYDGLCLSIQLKYFNSHTCFIAGKIIQFAIKKNKIQLLGLLMQLTVHTVHAEDCEINRNNFLFNVDPTPSLSMADTVCA